MPIHAAPIRPGRASAARPRPSRLHPWGSCTLTVTRYGGAITSLTLLPPDTSADRRRWVAISSAAPLVACVATVLVGLGLAALGVDGTLAFGVPAVLSLLLVVTAAREAGPALRRAVRVSARVSAVAPRASMQREVAMLERLVAPIEAAERDWREGRGSEASLREAWRAAYDELRLRELVRAGVLR